MCGVTGVIQVQWRTSFSCYFKRMTDAIAIVVSGWRGNWVEKMLALAIED